MNKIEIEGKLDRGWVVELMANGYTTYDIVNEYELTEDSILECTDLLDKEVLIQGLNFSEEFVTKAIEKEYLRIEDIILECTDLLDKEVLIQGLNFSEEFVTKAIEVEYLTIEDITELSMTTYSNLSDEFIVKYKENINWDRMILYISTQSDSFDNHTKVIEDKNLWSVISANDLSIDFIRQWKDKLDWSYLSMVKCFTDEEKQEFSDYILTPVQKELPEDLINTDSFKVTDKMSDEELENLIEEISKHVGKY